MGAEQPGSGGRSGAGLAPFREEGLESGCSITIVAARLGQLSLYHLHLCLILTLSRVHTLDEQAPQPLAGRFWWRRGFWQLSCKDAGSPEAWMLRGHAHRAGVR